VGLWRPDARRRSRSERPHQRERGATNCWGSDRPCSRPPPRPAWASGVRPGGSQSKSGSPPPSLGREEEEEEEEQNDWKAGGERLHRVHSALLPRGLCLPPGTSTTRGYRVCRRAGRQQQQQQQRPTAPAPAHPSRPGRFRRMGLAYAAAAAAAGTHQTPTCPAQEQARAPRQTWPPPRPSRAINSCWRATSGARTPPPPPSPHTHTHNLPWV